MMRKDNMLLIEVSGTINNKKQMEIKKVLRHVIIILNSSSKMSLPVEKLCIIRK